MADRVSVTIRLGGTLPRALIPALEAAIAADGAAIDWEGNAVTRDDLSGDGPLHLMATEVAWGRFEEIEAFCLIHRLPFARWSGGCAGSFPPERMVCDGLSEPKIFLVSEDDEVLISRATIRTLGSLAAVEAHFEAAELAIPPLELVSALAESAGGRHG